MKPDTTQIKVKALDECLIKNKQTGKPVKLFYMAQKTEQTGQKAKTYSEKEVKELLKKQKELDKLAIDAENISQYTARKKIDEAKLAIDK